jgi:type IV pilus assembly protein PilZ
MVDVSSKAHTLTLSITDKNELYAAYMPFVINGGLFISTQLAYEMHEHVPILLTLMDEVEPLAISGKVIWTTPPRTDSYRPCGIGIQFNKNDNNNVRNKIETYLAGILMSDRSTFTM